MKVKSIWSPDLNSKSEPLFYGPNDVITLTLRKDLIGLISNSFVYARDAFYVIDRGRSIMICRLRKKRSRPQLFKGWRGLSAR